MARPHLTVPDSVTASQQAQYRDKQLNGTQPSLILLFTPVLFLPRHVKMSSICRKDFRCSCTQESHPSQPDLLLLLETTGRKKERVCECSWGTAVRWCVCSRVISLLFWGHIQVFLSVHPHIQADTVCVTPHTSQRVFLFWFTSLTQTQLLTADTWAHTISSLGFSCTGLVFTVRLLVFKAETKGGLALHLIFFCCLQLKRHSKMRD